MFAEAPLKTEGVAAGGERSPGLAHRAGGLTSNPLRAVVAAGILVMALGVLQAGHAKVDVLPEFSPPTVEVQTEALGLSAEEVEQLITVPLEQDLLVGTAWLDSIHSRSVPGLSEVQLVFEPGTDLYRARQVVQERISQAAGLPNVSRPPQMLQPRSSTSRTELVSLSSKALSPIQIGVLARWTIRPRLLAVPGVANVAIWGQRERQLQVQVDPNKLRDHNISLERVISSAGNALWVSPLTFLEASTPGTGGFIDTPQQRIGIQHNLPIVTPQDLAQVPLDDAGDQHLTLGDVATVVEDHQPLIGDAIVNGGEDGAGFLLAVEKLPGANTTEVTRGVDEAIDELRPALTGLDVQNTLYRPAGYVQSAVDHVRRSALAGAVLAGIVLAALLFDWRRALVGAAAVALPFAAAALVLQLFGVTFNAVVLAGLAVALAAVAHDAVAAVHSVARGRQEVGDDEPAAPAMIRAAVETGRTLLWATVVFALALVPILLMNGLSGDAFFSPMAVAALVALVASLVVAATFTPALGVLLLAGAPAARESRLGGGFRRRYERALPRVVRTPVPALVVAGLLVLAAVAVVPRFDKALFPGLKDTNVLVRWNATPGMSLPEMDRITTRASDELRALPGVREVGVQVGQAVLGDQPVGSDSAEMWLRLDPAADYGRTLASVRGVVGGYPGMGHEVLTYSEDRMREVLGRSADPITVRIFGNDLGVLQQKAEEIKGGISGIDGIAAAHVAARPAEPTLEVEVDLTKARDVGIKPGDVRRAVATLLSGVRVGSLFEDQKVFDVQVWSSPQTRNSLSSVQNLIIDTPTGAFVRLGDVAAVRVRSTVPVITHQDISRFVDVTAGVRDRNVKAVAADVRDRLQKVEFPLEYHAELLGDYDHQQAAQRRLAGFALAAAVAMFLVLQAAFGSWRLAAITFVLLPVALTGGLFAAWIQGGPMTLATVAGLLAVLALAIRSALMLVSRLRRPAAAGADPPDADAPPGPDPVVVGAGEGAVPLVTAALVTLAVLLPVLVFGDISGQEVLQPMALVVVGGLVTTVLVNLFLLPALFVRFGRRETA
jgi:Cu/Ag efflux pump CusA